MEIEEVQAIWSEISTKLEKQKKLTDKIIITMTQERYKNKFRKLIAYETIGTVLCYAAAGIILVNIMKLDTWYLLILGIFTLLYLLVLPILVLRSIRKIRTIDLIDGNFKETIIRFTNAKKQLLRTQRIGIGLNFILVLAILPVFSKVFKNENIFLLENNTWIIGIPVLIVFLVIASRYGYRHYTHIAKSAERLVSELYEEGK